MYQIKAVAKWAGALALAMASNVALAQAVPAGTWKGAVQVGDKVSSIEIVFKPDKSQVRFGNPYSCTIGATFTRNAKGVALYNFGVSVNGGQPCNNLSGVGSMDITTSTDNKLHVTIAEKTRDGTRQWQADLEPATP